MKRVKAWLAYWVIELNVRLPRTSYMGIQYDENAPTGVSGEMMRAVGPDARVRNPEREVGP